MRLFKKILSQHCRALPHAPFALQSFASYPSTFVSYRGQDHIDPGSSTPSFANDFWISPDVAQAEKPLHLAEKDQFGFGSLTSGC